MRQRIAFLLVLLPCLILQAGCETTLRPTRRTNSALDFLYPQGVVAATPAKQVVLQLPVRVGLAFAPNDSPEPDPITEEQKQRLLAEVAQAFKAHEGIGHLEVVPSTYLQSGGSFANLDQVKGLLGFDLVVLLSYDQAQFTESTRASWTYLTVVGPFLIEGEKNDTRTLVDAVIYDIPSRALLFRAAGESTVKGRSSPLNVDRKRRKFAAAGFEEATDRLIANLNTALAQFEQQARNGTVQGPGTPAIAMYDKEGQQITNSSGGKGGGAFGATELVGAALLALALCGQAFRRTA
ncbi:MAG TPA: rhombotarget lipoprotein [Thermoanaerobaculia bacterium]|jgi:rhombotail lipoprotein|nr:rhombotarget lipoprotein [Thermoanaerobaculia bacterium]